MLLLDEIIYPVFPSELMCSGAKALDVLAPTLPVDGKVFWADTKAGMESKN